MPRYPRIFSCLHLERKSHDFHDCFMKFVRTFSLGGEPAVQLDLIIHRELPEARHELPQTPLNALENSREQKTFFKKPARRGHPRSSSISFCSCSMDTPKRRIFCFSIVFTATTSPVSLWMPRQTMPKDPVPRRTCPSALGKKGGRKTLPCKKIYINAILI